MKTIITLMLCTILAACTTTPSLPTDAALVVDSNGNRVGTPFGTLTARDWNNIPPSADTGSGESGSPQ